MMLHFRIAGRYGRQVYLQKHSTLPLHLWIITAFRAQRGGRKSKLPVMYTPKAIKLLRETQDAMIFACYVFVLHVAGKVRLHLLPYSIDPY